MKYRVKTVKVTSENRIKTRIIYETFDLAVREYRNGKGLTRMAPELKSDTKPLIKNSLAHTISRWIEQNQDTWEEDWATVLRKISDKDEFMIKGWGNLKPPNLAWLFGNSRNGDLGINRVLDGTLDIYKGHAWGGEEHNTQ